MTVTLPNTELLRDDLRRYVYKDDVRQDAAETLLTLYAKIGEEGVRKLIEGEAWCAPMEPTCNMRFAGHAHILHENQQSEFSIQKPDVQNFCAGLFRAMRAAHREETK